MRRSARARAFRRSTAADAAVSTPTLRAAAILRHDPAMRAFLLSLTLLTAAPAAAQVEVDLELVLAVDMSGSMDRGEHALQRGGYVAALRSPEVWEAVLTGAHQTIALSYLEWAGAHQQVVVMDWRLIDNRPALLSFADALEAQPLSQIRGTSISGGIDHARTMIEANGFEGWRKVVDVSGDGANNRGRPVTEARDAAVARGIVVNGLPIMLRTNRAEGDLARYYADCVVGGPGSFVIPVHAAGEMAGAIRRKLVEEIAGLGPPPTLVQSAAEPADCLIGERLRRLIWDN